MTRAVIGHTTVEELLAGGSLRTLMEVYPDEPCYREDGENGEPRWGLGPKGFHDVVNGYACPRCITYFDGIYRPKCPMCGYTRDIARDVFEEPEYWKPNPDDPYRNGS